MWNKKGEGTFEGWTQGMVFSVLFVIIFGLIIANMNNLYSQNYSIQGLKTDEIQKTFQNFQKSTSEKFSGGEVSFGDVVMSLSTSWDILISILKMLLLFIVSGEWISTVISYLMLPDAIAWGLRGLYIAGLFFILLRILFKVKT